VETVGAVQPGDETLEQPSSTSSLQESWRGTFYKVMEWQDKG